jgi:hypothetical protein
MSFSRYMKCLQTGMKREAVQEERSRGKGGGGGGGGDPGAGTNGTKEIRYIYLCSFMR